MQELTSSNTLSASLLTGGIDELFSRSEAGATQSFLTDALGSTLRLTDATGAKVVDYSYEAYGKASNDNAASTNTFQYTGRENDGTNLQFNRGRYYGPQLGRFISEYPIGLVGGYNQYTYVGGNPITRIDPDGRFFFVAAFGWGWAAAAADTAMAAGVAWWASNVSSQVKTPTTGDPDSSYTNPGNGQERKYGPNGNPEYDIDWHTDHGAGTPHGHNWDTDENGNISRGPGVPISPWPQGRKPNYCPIK